MGGLTISGRVNNHIGVLCVATGMGIFGFALSGATAGNESSIYSAFWCVVRGEELGSLPGTLSQ